MADLTLLVFTSGLFLCSSVSVPTNITDTFISFIHKYKRPYLNVSDEFDFRLSIFKENLENAERLNEVHGGTVFGVTKFSDMKKEEYRAQYLSNFRTDQHQEQNTPLKFVPQAAKQNRLNVQVLKLDWRDFGIISQVKNQGHCGACWAFASAEVIESAYAIYHNSTSVPNFSVQQLIDCSKSINGSNNGCNGGIVCDALRYVLVDGITYDSVYPLTDKDGMCMPVPSGKSVYISKYTCEGYINKEDIILSLLLKGPVAVAVDATTWNNYVGGIIRYHCEANINHAVDIVGYDLTGPVPYYIVRNSWGTDFGIGGYLYIEVGKNLCGIAELVSTVNIADKPQPYS